MNDVAGHVAGERVAPVARGKRISVVNGVSGRSGEEAGGGQFPFSPQFPGAPLAHPGAGLAPSLGGSELEYALIVIGDEAGDGRRQQKEVALEIATGRHHVLNVSPRLGEEATSPVVEAHSESRRSRSRLE